MSGQAITLKVFLSHTSEMAEYPHGRSFVQAAKDAVNEAGFLLDDMQYFPAANKSSRELDSERLLACDIYVGILGFKYGSTVRENPEVSYTQDEFRTARKAGKTLLIFLLDEQADAPLPPAAIVDPTNAARQFAFRQEVQNVGGKGFACQRFRNADDLLHRIVRSLQNT